MQSTTLELSRGERIKTAAKAALPYSAPMIAGFLFLGIAYGVYMKAIGFGVLYPMLMALLIYAGSVEFIAAGALVAPFSPLSVFLIALMVSGRPVNRVRFVQSFLLPSRIVVLVCIMRLEH